MPFGSFRTLPTTKPDRQTAITGPAPAATTPSAPQDPLALIAQYQRDLPANPDSLDEIVKRLNANGVQAARTTHANNTLVSNDAIVLRDGRVLDLLYAGGDPNQHWQLNESGTYDPGRSVSDSTGKFVPFSSWSTTPSTGSSTPGPATGSGNTPGSAPAGRAAVDQSGLKANQWRSPDGVVHTSVLPELAAKWRAQFGTAGAPDLTQGPTKPSNTSDMYAAAQAAMTQARKKAQQGGRSSTIGGGFANAARPMTAPATLLGRA